MMIGQNYYGSEFFRALCKGKWNLNFLNLGNFHLFIKMIKNLVWIILRYSIRQTGKIYPFFLYKIILKEE